MAVDEDLGLAYLPVETPSSDFYGGHRPGNNLFADSLVCVDLKTGQRKWHYQLVHHSIWNMDIAAAPILADITVNGKAIKAVLESSKQAFLYAVRSSDRPTGLAHRGAARGERRRAGRVVLTDAAVSHQAAGLRLPGSHHRESDRLHTRASRGSHARSFQSTNWGRSSRRPVVSKAEGPIAAFRSSGGMNWPGFSYDPETHIAYVPSFISLPPVGLLPPPEQRVFGHQITWKVLPATGVRYVSGPGENVGADAPRPAAREAGRGCAGAGRRRDHGRSSAAASD